MGTESNDSSLGLMLRFQWGEQRLHSELVVPGSRRGFKVGTAPHVDFPCADVAGAEAFELVPAGDASTVRFARGMEGILWRGDVEHSLHDAVQKGEAVADGSGYAVTLGRRDALHLVLGTVAVEAVPVRVPAQVAAAPFSGFDLRMVNILATVLVLAGFGIVAASAHENGEYSDDDAPRATQTLAKFVVPPEPPKKLAGAAPSTPTKAAPSKAGEAPPKLLADAAPISHGKNPKEMAQQLGKFMNDLFGKDQAGAELGKVMGGMRKVGLAGNGLNGLGLKGDGNGGGGGELIGFGGINRPGRGKGPGWAPEGVGILCKAGSDCKSKPMPDPVPSEVTIVGMDKELIRQVIHQHRNEVRYCYELELTRNPNLQGKTSVKFVINGSGGVSTSQVVESTVKSSALETCVAGKVRLWQFPKPPGGGQAIVTYPFVFRANGT